MLRRLGFPVVRQEPGWRRSALLEDSIMAVARLEMLAEEQRSLQTQLVQIQAMLRSIDDYISEELLQQAESGDEASEQA